MSKVIILALLAIAPLIASQALLGHYRFAAPGGTQGLNLIDQWLGRNVDIGAEFGPTETWEKLADPTWSLKHWGVWIKEKPGRRFLFSVPPWPENVGGNLASCARGDYNSWYRTLAGSLSKNGLSVGTTLRFAWEFTGHWFSWSAKNGQEANYAQCFRNFVTSVRTVSGDWKFEWNMNGDFSWTSSLTIKNHPDVKERAKYVDHTKAWPGSDVVDFIGIDHYDSNWDTYPFPAGCDSACVQQRQQAAITSYSNNIFGPTMDFAASKGKKIAVSEYGLWFDPAGERPTGLDNPYYIEAVHNWAKNAANNVAYVVYYDTDFDGQHVISPVNVTHAGVVNGEDTYTVDLSYKQKNFPVAQKKFKDLWSVYPGGPSNPVTTTRPATLAPTTTRPPTTTLAPTTTRPPTTTLAPTTTRPPTTTLAPTTTRPPTTVAPTLSPKTFQGESGTLSGLTRVTDSSTSGGYYVNGFSSSSATATFTFSTKIAGTCKFSIKQRSVYGSRSFHFILNGATPVQFTLDQGSSFTDSDTASFSCPSGSNTFRIQGISGQSGWDLDYVYVTAYF